MGDKLSKVHHSNLVRDLVCVIYISIHTHTHRLPFIYLYYINILEFYSIGSKQAICYHLLTFLLLFMSHFVSLFLFYLFFNVCLFVHFGFSSRFSFHLIIYCLIQSLSFLGACLSLSFTSILILVSCFAFSVIFFYYNIIFGSIIHDIISVFCVCVCVFMENLCFK